MIDLLEKFSKLWKSEIVKQTFGKQMKMDSQIKYWKVWVIKAVKQQHG